MKYGKVNISTGLIILSLFMAFDNRIIIIQKLINY